MKNTINHNESNNQDFSKIKSLLSTAVMTSLLTFNTQVLNALDNNFYERIDGEFSGRYYDRELEKLRLEKEIQKLKLLNSQNTKYNHYRKNNFGVSSIILEKKIYSLEHEGGIKFSKKKVYKNYRVSFKEFNNGYKGEKIIKIKLGNNNIKYNINYINKKVVEVVDSNNKSENYTIKNLNNPYIELKINNNERLFIFLNGINKNNKRYRYYRK